METYDEDPELGLALRMLYSALVIDAPEVYSFEEFWLGWSNLAMSPQIRLTLQLAVVACMQALSELAPSRAGMLLLVDEPRKLAKEFQSISGSDILADSNGVYKMIGALSRALDSNRSEVFNVALTTLDSLMLQAVSTASGRTIDWVGLDGLRQHEAEAMIMCALGRRSAPGAPVPALVALSVADCARHPRTLESLSQALVQRASEHVGCPDWFHKSGELSHIRREVFSSCGVGVAPLWAIRAALRGIALPYDAVIEGSGGTTFGDAIAKGVFLNTVEADTVTTVRIPRLSFMHLLKAAARELSVPVRKAINCMAVQEQVVFDNPRKSGAMQFGGSGFEGFVLHWLMLRFGLAAASGDGRGLSLEELFALDPGLADCGARVCDPRMTTGTPSHPLRFRHVLLADVSFADAAKSRGRINKVIADGGGVVTFIENNPAFDILLLVREVVKGVPVPGVAALPPLAIAIEARFSNLKSVVRTTAEEVSRKVELFNAQRGTFDALGIPADRVTYVIMASRLDGPVDSESAQLPHDPDSSLRLSSSDRGLTADEKAAFLEQGVLVLDRAGVERALTPTLVDRAFFLLSSSDFEGRRADINL